MAELLNTAFAGKATTPAPQVVTADNSDEDADQSTLTRKAARTLAQLSPVGRAEAATPARPGRARARESAEHWSVQVGAFAQQGAAEKAAAAALSKLPRSGARVVQVVPPNQSEHYFRARIVNFSERDAEKACRTLHKKHVQCAVIAPGPTQQMAANTAHHGG